MRFFVCITLTAFTLGSPSLAQTSPSDLTVSELVNACAAALNEGVGAEVFAIELVQRNQFNLGPENRANGKKCLETVFEAEFFFEGGRYNSPELIAADARRQLELELEQAERERLYNLAVVDACNTEYQLDRFRALTTPVCGLVFKSVGLP